ncbi:MAG: diguanylate cyclase domain-containing protein [Cyanobacterium sp.]
MVNDTPLKHLLSIELNTGKKVFLLEKNIHSVGRSSSNSIIINHRVTSRHHSSIIKVIYQHKTENKFDTAFWILDGDFKGNKSRNGVFVNAKKINVHKLLPGDIIILGGIEIKGKYDVLNIESKEFLSAINKNNSYTSFPSVKDKDKEDVLLTDVLDDHSEYSDYQELKHIDYTDEDDSNDHKQTQYDFIAAYCDSSDELIEGIIFIDTNTSEIIDCNKSLLKILDYEKKEDIFKLTIEDIFPIDKEILEDDTNLLIDNKYKSILRDSVIKKKGENFLPVQIKTRVISQDNKQIICLSILDLAEQRKIEELLRYKNYHNSITNLPNYTIFKEHLFSVLANYYGNEEGNISLVLVKINEWKEIGYKYNYEVAELVLKTISKKLKKIISAQDMLYHWHDDEFAFLLAQNTKEYLDKITYEILQIAQQPLSIKEETIQVSFSIGSASYPDNGDYEEILLQNADRTLTENYYEYIKGNT